MATLGLDSPLGEYVGRKFHARGDHAVEASGTVAGRVKLADGRTFFVQSRLFEAKNIFELVGSVFDSDNFGNTGHAANAPLQTGDVDDELDAGGDVLANDGDGEFETGHGDHHFESRQGVTRVVGVDGGQRTFVTRIHGLQHIEGFGTANFADQDAVGTHAKTVANQIALRDLAAPFRVGHARFQRDDVRMLQDEFGRIFDGYEAFVGGDGARQGVEHRRLSGTGTARDQEADPSLHGGGEEFYHFRNDRTIGGKIVELQRTGTKSTNRHGGPFDRQRRNDGVNARPIGQAGVDHRADFVDTPANTRNDAAG